MLVDDISAEQLAEAIYRCNRALGPARDYGAQGAPWLELPDTERCRKVQAVRLALRALASASGNDEGVVDARRPCHRGVAGVSAVRTLCCGYCRPVAQSCSPTLGLRRAPLEPRAAGRRPGAPS